MSERISRSEAEKAAAELEALVSNGTTMSFARVVQKIHAIDPEAEYDALIAHLDPDPNRTEFGVAYAYADAAESKARKALQLMAVARVEQKSFEFHYEREVARMRQVAVAHLQGEKESGARSKQITDPDVKACITALFPEEMAKLEDQKQRVTNVVDVATDLAKLAAGRCKTAQTMLSTCRK